MLDDAIDVEDVDILVAAQEKALRILSDARRQAVSRRHAARSETVELLLRQQKAAERLLAEQALEAVETASQAARHAAAVPTESREGILAEVGSRANELLKRQSEAAEALRLGAESDAVKKHEAVERDSTSILMVAHREAAAVLLQARMLVEDRQHARADSQRV